MKKIIIIFLGTILVLCFVCFCLFFCLQATNKYVFDSYIHNDINEYIDNKILRDGDIGSYQDMMNEVQDAVLHQEVMFYSIVMALKYDYPPAYYDVYHAMTSIYDEHPSLGKMDSKTQEEAFFFLKEGAVKGDEKCIKELDRLKQSKCKSY